MESKKAVELVRRLVIASTNCTKKPLGIAANREELRAIRGVLTALLGRKPTDEEVVDTRV